MSRDLCGCFVHSKLCSITLVATKVHVILRRFVVLAWMRGALELISVACDNIEFDFVLLSSSLVWSTTLGLPKRCGICMHQHSASDIKRRRRRRKLIIIPTGYMLTSSGFPLLNLDIFYKFL